MTTTSEPTTSAFTALKTGINIAVMVAVVSKFLNIDLIGLFLLLLFFVLLSLSIITAFRNFFQQCVRQGFIKVCKQMRHASQDDSDDDDGDQDDDEDDFEDYDDYEDYDEKEAPAPSADVSKST